jgi:hypothetical protein
VRRPVQISWDAQSIYERTCDLAHGRLTAEELFDIGRSLLILALSKMDQEEREIELNLLPEAIDHGLDGLDALRQRKKLNGHGPKGGLVI